MFVAHLMGQPGGQPGSGSSVPSARYCPIVGHRVNETEHLGLVGNGKQASASGGGSV